ncbi:MAG: hypothetical protein ABJK64_09410 [Paraglaciecola sp.]|uniref:hypothetical protein n=1 Tax=Paraglaciecola sp. TaxID=1920173 RepID=UPI00329A591B
MHKQHSELSKDDLFSLWLEGDLSGQQVLDFEALCLNDDEFSERVSGANSFIMASEHYQSTEVPNWDRNSTFEETQTTKWWQWQGLASLSFVTSCCAIVMVLTGLQIRLDEGAVTISFVAKPSSQEVETLVNEKMFEFQKAQQLALNQYTKNLQQQQLDASTQLTQYLLSASRKERREDFVDLIKHVNEQRGDDQLFYARQLNKLQQDIYAIPMKSDIGEINE